MTIDKSLAIVMCTFNGEKFLQPQLDSFADQSFKNWSLFVYDDKSIDSTENLVKIFGQSYSTCFASNNVALGFAKNFLNGIASTPDNFDFYALSDQDDIWLADKLKKAISYLEKLDKNTPALYCTRTILVDSTGNNIGFSPLFIKKPSFANALVQSIAGGNTMVFNRAARNLITKVGSNIDIVSHDWFIYQLISGAGGIVYYDSNPELLYRQHSNNLIGSNNGFFARLSRVRLLLNSSFRSWNDRNLKVLKDNSKLLTEENRNKLEIFLKSRESSIFKRLCGFAKCGIYRQTLLGNIALFIGGILNKI